MSLRRSGCSRSVLMDEYWRIAKLNGKGHYVSSGSCLGRNVGLERIVPR